MSQRENFGMQLTELCKSEKSVSDVCRRIGINRQQFGRYLAGTAMPSEKNLEKIARYFEVAPGDLFREVRAPGPEGKIRPNRFALSKEVLDLVETEPPSSVAPGNYYATFGYPQDPNVVVRSVMIVRERDNLTFFRRLTGFAEPRGTWWSLYGGDHRGIILDRRQHVHFVALNTVGNLEPTLMTMSWTTSEWPLLVGHAAVLGPNGPILTPVVVTPCSEHTSLRTAIRNSKVYSVDDANIESIVIDMLAEKGTALAQMLQPLDLSVQAFDVAPKQTGQGRLDKRL